MKLGRRGGGAGYLLLILGHQRPHLGLYGLFVNSQDATLFGDDLAGNHGQHHV